MFFAADKFYLDEELYPNLDLECLYVEGEAEAHWVWHRPDSVDDDPLPIEEELPICKSICTKDPIGVLGLRKSWDGEASTFLLITFQNTTLCILIAM